MIKTELSTGTDNSYNTGIINNGTEFGKIEIEITENIDKLSNTEFKLSLIHI